MEQLVTIGELMIHRWIVKDLPLEIQGFTGWIVKDVSHLEMKQSS